MAEDSSAEKTEEATARKLRNARDDGQVARSVELPAAAVPRAAGVNAEKSTASVRLACKLPPPVKPLPAMIWRVSGT